MTSACTITATYGNDWPLSALARLIALREKVIAKESTENAVTATALNVVTSLRGLTRVAPWKDNEKVPESSYVITEVTNLYPGFYTPKGSKVGKVCLRTAPMAKGRFTTPRSRIRPVMLVNPKRREALKAKVYKIDSLNRYDRFERNVNAPDRYWYVLAASLGAAKMYAESRIRRILKKEGGMANFTLAKAQAKIYNKAGGQPVRQTGGAKAWKIAAGAAQIKTEGSGYASGKFAIEVFDALNYSVAALKGGEGAMNTALMKAANRTAGMLRNFIEKNNLDIEKPETPFPDLAR